MKKYLLNFISALVLIIYLTTNVIPSVTADSGWSGWISYPDYGGPANSAPRGIEDGAGNSWSATQYNGIYMNGALQAGPRDNGSVYSVQYDLVGNVYPMYYGEPYTCGYDSDSGSPYSCRDYKYIYKCTNYSLAQCSLFDSSGGIVNVGPYGDVIFQSTRKFFVAASNSWVTVPNTIPYGSSYNYTLSGTMWDYASGNLWGYFYYQDRNSTSSNKFWVAILNKSTGAWEHGTQYSYNYQLNVNNSVHEFGGANRTYVIGGNYCGSVYMLNGFSMNGEVGSYRDGCVNSLPITMSLGNVLYWGNSYPSYNEMWNWKYLTPRQPGWASAYSNANRDTITIQFGTRYQIDAYRVYRDGSLIGTVNPNDGNRYIDTGAQSNRTYTYVITSINSGGESPGQVLVYYNPPTAAEQTLQAAQAAQAAAEAAKAAAQAAQASIADLQNSINYIKNTQLVNINNAITDGSGNTAISVSKAALATLSSGGQVYGMITNLGTNMTLANTKIDNANTSINTANGKLDSLSNDVDAVDYHISNLDNNLTGVKTDVNNVNNNVDQVQDSVDDLASQLGQTGDQLKSSLDEVTAIKSVVSLNKNSSSVDKFIQIAVDMKPGFTLKATIPGMDPSKVSWVAPDLCKIDISGLSASQIPDYIQIDAYSGSTYVTSKKIYRKDFYFELIDIN